MKHGNIKSFSVYGLFGTSDVHIPFEKSIKILIGENGLGKTQVLNIFYYALTRNFLKLSEFPFDRLEINFYNSASIKISKNDIDNLVEKEFKEPILKDIINKIGYARFDRLRNEIAHGLIPRNRIDEHPLFRVISKIAPFEIIIHLMEKSLYEERKKKNRDKKQLTLNSDLEGCEEQIEKNLKGWQLLYFPTFRRVEEDLRNLGYDEDNFRLNREDNRLIHFGMDDVKSRFDSVENKIDKMLKDSLAQFTKDILNVVIDDATPSDNILDKISEDDIDIILSRVGTLLPPNQKDAVKNIVSNKQLKNPLSAYLLQKLVEIYEKQKEIDNSVKIFRDVCNKYLLNKKVFYDESAIKIYIKSSINNKEILLSKLSSGEKQIISIFSKIYLDNENQSFIMLFDEPELSLSMLWQKQLLPDIINSKKCEFLLAVTHSPFIFENELDEYAVGLSEYIKPAMNKNKAESIW